MWFLFLYMYVLACIAFFSLLAVIIKGPPVSVGPLESLFPFLPRKLRETNLIKGPSGKREIA